MTEWLFIIVFGVFTLIALPLILWLLVYAARQATRTINECKACGYDLHGLPSTTHHCPECGRPFDINERGDTVS